MSSQARTCTAKRLEDAVQDDSNTDEGTMRTIERHSNSDTQFDQDNSSTGSDSSTQLREVKSAADLPVKRHSNSKRKFKPNFYFSAGNKRYSNKTHSSKSSNMLEYQNKCHRQRTLEVTPESSTEDIPRDCYKIKEVGNLNSQEPFACSIYITSYNAFEDHLNMQVTIDPFADTLNNIASGKIKVQKTKCGIIVAFTRKDDEDKVMNLPLQHIFGGPIQVVKFSTGEIRFRRPVIIKDIPWCISNVEIHEALKMQGIAAGKVIRTRSHVKTDVLNALDVQRLVEEGLNFFNYTTFSAVVENNVNQGEPDIIQCFKCQGFWHTSAHCRQIPRCVRCGENHNVEYCPRPRNSPICCHCGGPHHAAYKMCPVRLQHINSTYVGFELSRNKPNRSLQHNMF